MTLEGRSTVEQSKIHRPIGIWALTICHTIYAALGILRWGHILVGPLPHGWSSTALEQAPFAVTLYVGLLASAWWAWTGSTRGRVLLLSVLSIAIGLSITDDVLSFLIIADERSRNPETWSTVALWTLVIGLILLAWLALNLWYFLGRRTRQFYKSTRTEHSA